MFEFTELSGEGVYYCHYSMNPNYSLNILNNNKEYHSSLVFSLFNDSFYQAFYFYKNDDNTYLIMNLNSLKILGVESYANGSPIVQNIISPSENYKWNIVKINYYTNEYCIELKYGNKRIIMVMQ